VRVSLGPAAVALVVVLLSGCAARRPADTSARSRAVSIGATIEASDQRLSAALLNARAMPSPEHDLAVAREYQRLRILDAADKWLDAALRRAPRLSAAHEERARIWRDWGLLSGALGHAHRAVAFDPGSASARNTFGTVLDALGHSEAAREAYLQALALEPTAGWALNNLCYLEFRLGRLNEARERCEAAVRVSPDLAAAHNNLGLTHAASGNMAGASQAFFAAGDEAAAHFNLGVLHLAGGRFAEAATEFELAIKARPSFTAAKSRAHNARMRSLTQR
jgi:protein O-GlcNAc transferase